jgi:hypothetical protein
MAGKSAKRRRCTIVNLEPLRLDSPDHGDHCHRQARNRIIDDARDDVDARRSRATVMMEPRIRRWSSPGEWIFDEATLHILQAGIVVLMRH